MSPIAGMLYAIEGTGQTGLGSNFGDGFASGGSVAGNANSDPAPFFTALLAKPYLTNVIISPHVCESDTQLESLPFMMKTIRQSEPTDCAVSVAIPRVRAQPRRPAASTGIALTLTFVMTRRPALGRGYPREYAVILITPQCVVCGVALRVFM